MHITTHCYYYYFFFFKDSTTFFGDQAMPVGGSDMLVMGHFTQSSITMFLIHIDSFFQTVLIFSEV